MLRKNVIRQSLMLLLPMVLLTGCVSKSPYSSSAQSIPPLSAEARQPETPSICLPTCSAGLMRERENWRASLTGGESPAGSVSAVTTR